MRETLILLLCLILFQSMKGHTDAAESDQSCRESHQMEKECGVYAHTIVKPMMSYFDQVNQKMERNEAEIESKNKQIRQLTENVFHLQMRMEGKNDKINKLEMEVASCKDKIINLLEGKDESNSEIIKSLRDLLPKTNEKQIDKLDKSELKNERKWMSKLESENKELVEVPRKIDRKELKYCTEKGSSGVQNVTISNGFTFEVLCNSNIAGPGWAVVQQRIRGGVNFYRGWTTYRNGFGDFWDGDFFIGLEKIHKLTNEQPHELYIHMENFNGSTIFAKYDDFAISGEEDHYRLYKLGGFSGNSRDSLRSHINMKFTTTDRDNDQKSSGNCAQLHHGGWWYTNCMSCNLNGKFSKQFRSSGQCIFWENWKPLKLVTMMIRPKAV